MAKDKHNNKLILLIFFSGSSSSDTFSGSTPRHWNLLKYESIYTFYSITRDNGNGKHYSTAASNSSMSDTIGCGRTFLEVSIIGIEDKPDSNDDIDINIDTAALAEKIRSPSGKHKSTRILYDGNASDPDSNGPDGVNVSSDDAGSKLWNTTET